MNRIVEVMFNVLFWCICYYLFIQIFAVQTVDIQQFGNGKVIRNVTYSHTSVWSISIGFVLKIAYYYFNVYYLSRYFSRWAWGRYFKRLLPVTVTFIIMEVIKMNILYSEIFWSDSIISLVLQYVVITVMSVAHFLLIQSHKDQIVLQQLHKEKAMAELKALKSQVNPHFLFNAFNNLLSITNKSKNEEASQVIMQLSDMMRFMLEDMSQLKIPIQKEIEFIINFIDINKLRFAKQDNIQIDFSYEGDLTRTVEPGLLIPLVENAFKHGIHPLKPSYVEIHLLVSDDDHLEFKLSNSLHKDLSIVLPPSESRDGIGLKNLKSRLQLAYPGKHEFFIKKDDISFEVQLNLQAL